MTKPKTKPKTSCAWEVGLVFEDVPDKEVLNQWVWAMRQAGRDHAGVPFPTYEWSRKKKAAPAARGRSSKDVEGRPPA